MEKIKIATTQNVDIEYPVASLGDRILAYLIDLFILIVYLIIGSIIVGNVINAAGYDSGAVIMIIAIYLPAFLYDLLCELFLDGQSFGKMALKIKVVKRDGSSAGLSSYLLRWLLRPIDIYVSSGAVAILTIFFNGKGQRLGDIAGGTTVIKLKEDTSIDDTILTNISTDYELKYPEVEKLNDEDMAVVCELIDANSVFDVPEKIISASFRAKNLLEEKMGIKSDQQPLDFFMTILRDYNHIHGKV